MSSHVETYGVGGFSPEKEVATKDLGGTTLIKHDRS
jgi:hypothetical protein